MKKIFILALAVVLVGAFSFFNVETCPAQLRYISIGTASVSGVYYPVGGAVAKLINKKTGQYNIKMTVESTAGAVFNINATLAGDLDLSIAQSDQQYNAWHGVKEFKDKGPQKELRSICSLYPEVFNLMVADDSGIEKFMDIKGKHINISNPGSVSRILTMELLETCGIDWRKDIRAEGVAGGEAPKLLQDGRIDGFFYILGHPTGLLIEATAGRRKVHFVPVIGPCVDDFLAKNPYFVKTVIPIKNYTMATNKEDVPSWGVKSTIITTAKLPDDFAYALTKEIFDNLDEFRGLHPVLARVTKQNMLEGLTAPIHPGALKYYKEVGLK